jgi:hypothetical protein
MGTLAIVSFNESNQTTTNEIVSNLTAIISFYARLIRIWMHTGLILPCNLSSHLTMQSLKCVTSKRPKKCVTFSN